ncbi:MAG: glycosyltransferase family 4 protein [Bacteroidales bacterium]|jgi:glycosyltransferase involved in cell wall biosynthesis
MPENKIKVAYLIGSLNRGGTETLLLDCFLNSREAGFSFIGVHRKEGSLLNCFRGTGVPFFHLGFRNKFDLGYFFRLRALLIDQQIDIAHAQQPIDAMLALISLWNTGIKVVLTMHGFDFTKRFSLEFLNRFILKQTSVNIYVSKTQKKIYSEKYHLSDSSRNKVVYNGISFNKFERTSLNSIRKEFGIPQNTLLLCSIGNFVRGRDQLTICHFLSLLRQKQDDFCMIFAGARSDQTPDLFDECVSYCKKNGLQNHVFFPGSRKDVIDILSQSDAFIYASDHDTFGIAVIEAMAAGTPVFVNDWEVMKEISDNGKNVNLYKTKDEYDLFQRFLHFLNNREIYRKQAHISSLWAHKTYSIKSHLDELKNIYVNLIRIN